MKKDFATRDRMIEDMKKLYNLYLTSEINCIIYVKRFYIDNRYNSWVEKEYADKSYHTLEMI